MLAGPFIEITYRGNTPEGNASLSRAGCKKSDHWEISTLELNSFLVLELPPGSLRRAESELIPVQLEFNMWRIKDSGQWGSRSCASVRRFDG
jgi:hypothetical protein